MMNLSNESGIEVIESEEIDLESSPAVFEIVTYPADFTLEGLVNKYRKKQLKIPGFQRRFVWKLPQASRLIESFLLGLPVPAIFLFVDPNDNSFEVIDGQQRLLSIVYFFEGFFGPKDKGKRTVFTLSGLNDRSPYLGKTYDDLKTSDPAAFNRLNDSVLRAFVIKQLNPEGDTSIYHIFERLNTGGTQLSSQEIRNCVYHGTFNSLLHDLNNDVQWRTIFGNTELENRQKDIELILRFFALYFESSSYKKPMKDFLSNFMKNNRNARERMLDFSNLFRQTANATLNLLGAKPFHIKAGLNVAVFDAVFITIAKSLQNIPSDISLRYQKLIKDEKFLKCVTASTTDDDVVKERQKLAFKSLIE